MRKFHLRFILLPWYVFALIFLSVPYAQSDQTENQRSGVAGAPLASPEETTTEGDGSNKANEQSDEASASGEQEPNPLDLGFDQVISAEEITEDWINYINRLLERYELSGSFVGKVAASIGIFFATVIIHYCLKWIIRLVRRRTFGLHVTQKVPTKRLMRYRSALIFVLRATYLIAVTSCLVLIWHSHPDRVFESDAYTFFLQNLFSLVALGVVGVVVFEFMNFLLNQVFQRLGGTRSRADTLFPILRNIFYASFFVLFGLTLLSELGINVVPLLAGAGVVGFAVGFGAQTLVKDLITGIIIIIEDLFQVGDVVGVGGRIGLVERITIRKVQLRDLEGKVYTIPFSEISIVENYTKDFSFYLMDIGVAYKEDTDEVIELLRSIDEELRSDERYGDLILDKLEIFGVDKFADSAVVIKARIKTKPIEQWNVGREFNRRMKIAFDERGIEIPFPHQTIYFGENKPSNATPPARLRIMERGSERAIAEPDGESRADLSNRSNQASTDKAEAPDQR